MHHDWLSYSREGNVLQAFLYPNKVVSTIHQKDRLEVGGKRLEKKQTSDNQTSDRKPSRLLFRLQTEHISRLSYIPTRWYQLSTDVRRSPFLSRKERRFAFSFFRALGCLPFYKRTFRFTPAILMKLHSHSTLSSLVILSFCQLSHFYLL